ncbi:MAG: DUF502 domain-containing protein [Phycisphaera sp.]|nr:DUF502 domain-containing protein [Phycisphaera sp.]
MSEQQGSAGRANFRRFFFRGLGIVLPTVLTIWILVVVYQFVDTKIATPINKGIQEMVLSWTSWPQATEGDISEFRKDLTEEQRQAWKTKLTDPKWVEYQTRRTLLLNHWNRLSIGSFVVLDLIGLFVAVILIYFAGLAVGSFVGRKLYARGERMLQQLPLFKQVYPYVKQVTDFLVGNEQKIQFNKVVAVQYPRKGLWSVGLVTGNTMQSIQDEARDACITVFVPSSPTPFTGYVITVPVSDTIELPITIDEALRFTVSGGVIVPPGQTIPEGEAPEPRPSVNQLEREKGDGGTPGRARDVSRT